MGMFDSTPRTPKVRQHFDSDNFMYSVIGFCVLVIAAVIVAIVFIMNYEHPLTPSEAKEKTEQQQQKIEHKEYLLEMCKNIDNEKDRVDCMGKVEDEYWGG